MPKKKIRPDLKKPQVLLPIIIIGALLIGVLLGQIPTQQTNQLTQQPISGLEVAKKMAAFLDKTDKGDGTFHIEYTCKESSCSLHEEKDHEPHSNGQIITFYHELYKLTGDTNYQQKADKAIEYWFNRCLEEGSISFSCSQNYNPFSAYYRDTQDKKYLDVMKKAGEPILKLSTKELLTTASGNKLAILYELTQDKKYLNKLEEVGKKAMVGEADMLTPTIYAQDGFSVRMNTTFILLQYYLPLYKFTNNPEYLKAAQDTLDKSKLTQNIDKLKENNKIGRQLMLGIGALLTLAEITGNNSYKDQAQILGQELLYDFWDTPENKKYDGGYQLLDDPFKINSSNTVDTVDMAETARFFIKMKDEHFILTR